MAKIDQLRDKTYHEAIELLNHYKKGVVIRPTGFGKTGILTRIIKNYKNIIYLYPAAVIKDTVIDFYNQFHGTNISEIPDVTFMTYAKLSRLTSEQIKEYNKTDLIISDECHLLGATKTSRKIKKLLKSLPDVHLLGATATPDRMDLVDEISLFFDNRVVSKYTLHDAFQDGVLQKPHYCFCSYNKTPDPNSINPVKLLSDPTGEANTKDLLRSRLIEISDLQNIENVIKTQCDAVLDQTNHMKFIVFFSSFEHLHDKSADVATWFTAAYPTHKLETMIISSEKTTYANNTKKLNHNRSKHNTIELIYCCNMLNLGYHVGDLTGVVMYRGTESSIIFAQQLGRVLNSGHHNNCIVFDVVDNIHRESVYDVLGQKPKRTKARNERYKLLKKQLDDPKANPLNADEIAEFNNLSRAFEPQKDKWWIGANQLQPEDLIATGHIATYRELIAKTVAEPIAMRARQAWSRWIEDGGDPKDMTAVAILNQKAPYAIPLGPYCRSKQVTIKLTLDTMGVK